MFCRPISLNIIARRGQGNNCQAAWQWQFTGVWTAVHRRNCRGPLHSGRRCRHSAVHAFRQPSTTCSTSLPTQHLPPSGTFSVVGPKGLELSPRFSSATRPSVQTVSDVCLKRTCSFDSSAFRALEVLEWWMNEWKCEDFKCVWKPTESQALSNTLCKQIKPLSEVKPEMVR